MYEIKEVSRDAWDSFVQSLEFSPFVQSPSYADFYAAMDEQGWIFGIYKNTLLVGGSLVLSTHAKRGHFLYLPYGPILDYNDTEMLAAWTNYIQTFAKKEGYDFVRMSPLLEPTQQQLSSLHSMGYRRAPMHVLAENSWLLDLTPDEGTLMKNMKKNHRNLIRRCEREGVKIRISTEPKDLVHLNRLLDVTEKKHNFTRFSDTYIKREFDAFAKRGECALFIASLPTGEIDAVAMIMFYGNMAVYRHSASINIDKKIPTSYLIQWHVIQEAKKRGMRWYNFWGVNPADEPNHPFAGIGHFKRGFGGMQKDLLPCHDLPITKKYWLNWIIETVRRIKRGF